MSKRRWAAGCLVAAGLALVSGGCSEPTVINAAPPGIDARSIAEVKEKEEPQAIGETGGKAAKVEPPNILPDIEPALPTAKGEVKTTKSGVKYETIKEGTGAVAKAGQRIDVHYVGTLDDGRKFDSSRDRNQTTEFTIGIGKVIKGWDEAVPGMKIGEIRKMTIPASAGYGALGAGDGKVPPNATLHFEIELVNIR
jgi:FKBP-type peptidyl-prolyl cis-trans isomerase FkpA